MAIINNCLKYLKKNYKLNTIYKSCNSDTNKKNYQKILKKICLFKREDKYKHSDSNY